MNYSVGCLGGKKNAEKNADCGSQGNKVSEKKKDSFGNLVTEHSHCTLLKKLAKSYLCPENMTEAELKSDWLSFWQLKFSRQCGIKTTEYVLLTAFTEVHNECPKQGSMK